MTNRRLARKPDPVNGTVWHEWIVPQIDDPWRQPSAQTIERDGYEVYFDDAGFELTTKDPDTRQRVQLLEVRDLDIKSPAFVATLLYVLNNPQQVAKGSDNV